MKKACVVLADGFEEIEALTPVDYLRRAGIEVTMIGLAGQLVRGAHDIAVMADLTMAESSSATYDAVILPGGMPGARNLAESKVLREFLLRHFHGGKIVAAICAAPAVVLEGACGLLAGRHFTGYPGSEAQVPQGIHTPGRVVKDGNLITSRGPGTAGEFAIALIEALAGAQTAQAVAEKTLLKL
jgi:4-methyl-5(b-hydroxyethyl)-thiazole monophosphate biosynthesis